MTRRRAVAALLLVVGAAGAGLFFIRSVTLPGTRGAARIASGFRPGRWDARFVVARGPAAVVLPADAMHATLTLSGPATVTARHDGVEISRTLTSAPEPWAFDLPGGGTIALEADGALRLHQVHLERRGGAASAGFVRLTVLALWDRARPLSVVALVLVGMAVAAAAARGVPLASRVPPAIPALAAAALFASCAMQVLLLPQPQIIGDPGAYFDMAARFRDAFRAPLALGDAMQDLRPYGGLAFTGTLYGLLRLLRDDASTLYLFHAAAMGGAAFFLIRAAHRLAGRRGAVVAAILVLAYATYPVICGIVQPEPFILLLWCFACDRLVAFAQGDAPRRLVPAGLAFALGLALHPQGIWYLVAAVGLVLVPFAGALRRPRVAQAVLCFAAGASPVAFATAAGEAYARPAVHVLEERYGFFAYTVPYPLGFWLFLETDGWQGPVRLDQTRYALEFDAARDTGRLESGLDRWRFTGTFVARRAADSLRAVLRNLYRLYRQPDNPFHRTWILPYRAQVVWHQAIVVAFLLAVPLLIRSAGALAIVPVAILAATYPLYHVFNKYALPATPFLILGAALLAVRLLDERPRILIGAVVAAIVLARVRPAALALAGLDADLARWSVLALSCGALLAAFVWVLARWAAGPVARAAGVLALAGLVAARAGAEWDDPSWRAFEVPTSEGPRQQIVVDDEALRLLHETREVYLALDLHLPEGDPSLLRLEFASGLVVPGSELRPTMPTFGLATLRGDRDPRAFAQWWVTAWRPGMMAGGRLDLTIRGAEGAFLRGDVGEDPRGSHHGLSLGQWPFVSVYRLMHEGEYRLPLHQPVDPAQRQSWRGSGRAFAGTYGVRIVALDPDAGGAEWEAARVAAGDVVVAIWARAGRSAPAELIAPAGTIPFELGGTGPWRGAAGELRHVPTGEYEGWYLLRTHVDRPGPLVLRVQMRHDMVWMPPRYFLPGIRPSPPVPPDWAALPLAEAAGAAGREAPPWRPIAVY